MYISSIFQVKNIDHYAVHVSDISQSQKFHIDNLGFSFVKRYTFRTSETSSSDDTVSVVLKKVFEKKVLDTIMCVLNQPLNEYSVLSHQVKKYGEMIHHIAYSVDDIYEEFQRGVKNNICFTTEDVIIDNKNSIKQIFIDKRYTGYFLELIQREDNIEHPNLKSFDEENIKRLMISSNNYI